ncbi:hypothetical protein BgiBS90_034878 [Biomphalaria glabrata]|nr:hypothetical protein BgiBS90_034878 [Biomphalaria glabrata]
MTVPTSYVSMQSSNTILTMLLGSMLSSRTCSTVLYLCSLDIGSSDIGSLDIGSLDTGSLDIGSLDIGSSDIGSLDIGSSDIGSLTFFFLTVNSRLS